MKRTPADTLVEMYPDRVTQLLGPVFAYLNTWNSVLPYNGTEQDLVMSIFVPSYRRENPYKPLPALVQKYNPGIVTTQDYLDLINGNKRVTTLTAAEEKALRTVAHTLNVPRDSLFKQINFESGWDPLARNSVGARGLIQFMPDTAEGMGFKTTASSSPLPSPKGGAGPSYPLESGMIKGSIVVPALLMLGAAYYVMKKNKIF